MGCRAGRSAPSSIEKRALIRPTKGTDISAIVDVAALHPGSLFGGKYKVLLVEAESGILGTSQCRNRQNTIHVMTKKTLGVL